MWRHFLKPHAVPNKIRSGLLGQVRGYWHHGEVQYCNNDVDSVVVWANSFLDFNDDACWGTCMLPSVSYYHVLHVCDPCAISKPCRHVQLHTADTPCPMFFEEELYWTGANRESLTMYTTNWITVSDSCVCLNLCTPRYSWQDADWWCHMCTCSCICIKG